MKTYFFPTLIMVFIFCSCSESVNEPNSSIVEQTIVATKNQKFSFELEARTCAGYQWDYSISNPSVLQIDSNNYRPKNDDLNLVGGPTIETFYFTAKKYGVCIINLSEHRAWLKDVPPINTARYIVYVQY